MIKIRSNDGILLTIPYSTLAYIEETFSPAAVLSSKRVLELAEGQQLGYIKGVSDIISTLKRIAEQEG